MIREQLEERVIRQLQVIPIFIPPTQCEIVYELTLVLNKLLQKLERKFREWRENKLNITSTMIFCLIIKKH